jgi:hypothetical protein
MARPHALFLLASLTFLTAAKFDKLESNEQAHVRALSVFMDKDQTKAFYKLKTPEERNAYLQELKLWDRFYQFDDQKRQQIVASEVQVGFELDALFMAWGAPFAKNRLTGRNASRSERLVYRFEVDADGFATPLSRRAAYKAVDRYQVEVIVDDNIVTKLTEKATWD